MDVFIRELSLTIEQKQCPHCSITGASKRSRQMLHRSALSSCRSPGAFGGGGKSVGSGTVSRENRVSLLNVLWYTILYASDKEFSRRVTRFETS